MNESLSFIFLCLASFQKCTQIWRYSLEVRAQESKSKQATEREKEKIIAISVSSRLSLLISNRCCWYQHLMQSMAEPNTSENKWLEDCFLCFVFNYHSTNIRHEPLHLLVCEQHAHKCTTLHIFFPTKIFQMNYLN